MSEMPKWSEDAAVGCTCVHYCTGWSKIISALLLLKSSED